VLGTWPTDNTKKAKRRSVKERGRRNDFGKLQKKKGRHVLKQQRTIYRKKMFGKERTINNERSVGGKKTRTTMKSGDGLKHRNGAMIEKENWKRKRCRRELLGEGKNNPRNKKGAKGGRTASVRFSTHV